MTVTAYVPVRYSRSRIFVNVFNWDDKYAEQMNQGLRSSFRHRKVQWGRRERPCRNILLNSPKISTIDMRDLNIVLYTSISITLSRIQVRTCVTPDIPLMLLRPKMSRPTILPNQLSTIRTEPLP